MDLITQDEAALRAGVTTRTILRWARTGVLTPYPRRMPSGQPSVMVDAAEVDAKRVPPAPSMRAAPGSANTGAAISAHRQGTDSST